MRDSAYRISLDIHEAQSQVSLPVKLGDTARRIYITLTESGKPFEIDNECVAIFSAIKSDGNRIFNDCIIEDNRIRYDITAQTVAAEGIVSAEIILYGSDEAVLASPRFDLIVDDRVAGVATISEDEKNFFDSFILSEQERVANEQNRIKEFNNLGLSVEDDGDNYKLIKTNKDGSKQEFLIAKGKNGENGKDYVITSADYAAIADKVATDNLEEAAEKYIDGALAEMDLDITKSASGNTITIDSANAPLQSLKLYGKTTQNGTPTPDAPIPLVSVGDSGSFEVGVFGKNLLEIPREAGFTTTKNGVVYTVQPDKSISVSGTPTDTTTWKNLDFKDYKFSLPIGNYKFACKGLVNSTGLHPILYYINSENKGQALVTYSGKDVESIPFTITNENKDNIYLVIGCAPGYIPQGERLYISIFPESVTDLSYEPYTKQTLTMPYTLRSVGVQDVVDFAKETKTENTIAIVFDGSEDEEWILDGNLNTCYVQMLGFKPVPTNVMPNIMCSMTKEVMTKNECQTTNKQGVCITEKGILVFRIDGITSSLENWKAYLQANLITVIGERQTPIETPLSETELNAYRQLYTNKGTTTILSEADMELDYYINKPNAQAIGSLHEQINKDYIKLQQAIISTGGSTL